MALAGPNDTAGPMPAPPPLTRRRRAQLARKQFGSAGFRACVVGEVYAA